MASILKLLFDVLVAALILTAFEIIFFKFSISLTISNRITRLITLFAKTLQENVNGIFKLPTNLIKAISDEEAILVTKFNESVMYDGTWIAGLLVISLLGISCILIYNDSFKPEDERELNGHGIMVTIAFSIGTTTLFAIFQWFFAYRIAACVNQNECYQYPSNDEAQYIATNAMITSLRKNLQN